jgi:hypothetical protein
MARGQGSSLGARRLLSSAASELGVSADRIVVPIVERSADSGCSTKSTVELGNVSRVGRYPFVRPYALQHRVAAATR